MTFLWILLNPYNLIAMYFAMSGLAMWGVGESYKMDYSLISLFKLFGVPTIFFGLCWYSLSRWKKIKNWKMYFIAFILSLIIMLIGSFTYWRIVGRDSI